MVEPQSTEQHTALHQDTEQSEDWHRTLVSEEGFLLHRHVDDGHDREVVLVVPSPRDVILRVLFCF
jgi:hypothetical protein